ncbi:MAG: hydroxymethylbilane synthase [Candidatus Obscuribacter sp.]|nr:hydroxymethylbilane synthase [Candidatus Obscuribacter sp.]
MTPSTLTVGTRESRLACLQTDQIVEALKKHYPELELKIHHVTTHGDKVLDRPIAQLGGRGVFVKELEEALFEGTVDLVVHSLKDLPTDMPSGLTLACVLNRDDPRDVFLGDKADSFASLKPGSTVATSSRRRAAQLLALRQDLRFVDMRGNIPTRVRKLQEGQCDAMILAAAGLHRLGLQAHIKQYFELDVMTPAAGQGALAVECRSKDKDIIEMLKNIENPGTRFEITAERAFLDELGGGCSVPAGALCIYKDNQITITGTVAALDGSAVFRASVSGAASDAHALGKALANQLQEDGAEKILEDLRQSTPNTVSPP